jgi:cytochrome bd-type quinol oxidase subunit 2
MNELLLAFCIYILVPAAGLAAFILLDRRIRLRKHGRLLELAYFLLFFALGGWLLIALTSEFLEWSGMASLGMFYLLLVAPFLSMTIAWKLRRRKQGPLYSLAFWGHVALSTTIVLTASFLFNFPIRVR